MDIADFLNESKTTHAAFARKLGITRQAVGRYTKGKRIPGRETMRAIHRATGGRVMPNDFYGLGDGHG